MIFLFGLLLVWLLSWLVLVAVVVCLVVVDELAVPLVEDPVGELACLEGCFDVM